MTNKLILSWQDIETDSKALSKKISLPIDLIVAITKGGLPIATLLTNKHLKNPPIITLQLKEIKTEEKSNYKAQKVKIISPLNIYPIKGKRVLIIDDVADTGATLKKAVNLVKKHQPKILITACLHYKPRTTIKPDIFAKKIDNHVWIVYPWE